MRNMDPATRRDLSREREDRHCRRPTPQEVAGARGYVDPRFRDTALYVAGAARSGAAGVDLTRGEDARVDRRAYVARHSRDRRT